MAKITGLELLITGPKKSAGIRKDDVRFRGDFEGFRTSVSRVEVYSPTEARDIRTEVSMVLSGVPPNVHVKWSTNVFLRLWPVRRRYLWMDDLAWDHEFLVRASYSPDEVRMFLDQERRDRIMARLAGRENWELRESTLRNRFRERDLILDGVQLKRVLKYSAQMARIILGNNPEQA